MRLVDAAGAAAITAAVFVVITGVLAVMAERDIGVDDPDVRDIVVRIAIGTAVTAVVLGIVGIWLGAASGWGEL